MFKLLEKLSPPCISDKLDYVRVDKVADVEAALGTLEDARLLQDADCIRDDLCRDRRTVLGVPDRLQPRLYIFLWIAPRLLDILDIVLGALLRRVERADVGRERVEEWAERVWRSAGGVRCDEPRGPGGRDRADLCRAKAWS